MKEKFTEEQLDILFHKTPDSLRSWIGKYKTPDIEDSILWNKKTLPGIYAVIHFSDSSCHSKKFLTSPCRCIVRKYGEEYFYEMPPHIPGKCPYINYKERS